MYINILTSNEKPVCILGGLFTNEQKAIFAGETYLKALRKNIPFTLMIKQRYEIQQYNIDDCNCFCIVLMDNAGKYGQKYGQYNSISQVETLFRVKGELDKVESRYMIIATKN